ncbi:MAG: hypothetical protein V5A84_05390, partial [Planctomycetota bacterium]
MRKCTKMVMVAAVLSLLSISSAAAGQDTDSVTISSLKELDKYSGRSGHHVKLEPGLYHLSDYLPAEKLKQRGQSDNYYFMIFSGSNNVFDMGGVTLVVNNKLREALSAPVHRHREFVISGDGNVFKGLSILNTGAEGINVREGSSRGGSVLSVQGDGNTLRDLTLHVEGSWPYGYGDLLGKGRNRIVGPLRKQTGLYVGGDNNRILGCSIYMRALGHGFQLGGAKNNYFENCYVEGEMRSTDAMLDEGPGELAHKLDYRMQWHNRQGEQKIPPGYMQCLAEDGFRHYGGVEGSTYVNCTAKNMRHGFAMGSGTDMVKNCTATGCETAFLVGNDIEIINSRGDAKYGPLLYLQGGKNSDIEIELMPAESDWKIHTLATIAGSNHEVTITPYEGKERDRKLPIHLGYGRPAAGKGLSS